MKHFKKFIVALCVGSLFQTNGAVLLQQYIRGIEYAVDVVSRKGQQEVAAVYKYNI